MIRAVVNPAKAWVKEPGSGYQALDGLIPFEVKAPPKLKASIGTPEAASHSMRRTVKPNRLIALKRMEACTIDDKHKIWALPHTDYSHIRRGYGLGNMEVRGEKIQRCSQPMGCYEYTTQPFSNEASAGEGSRVTAGHGHL